jgi:transcriptional regulator with PAS, ATPase and Fis domain
MKSKLCIVGYPPVIAIGEEIAAEYGDDADFIFVNSLLEQAFPHLKEVQGIADIVLAGPSTRRMYANDLSIPIISFRPTFPDLIRAIQEAKTIDLRIALCLSRDDVDFDLPLLSQVMAVSLVPFYCDTGKEYEDACLSAKEEGLKVVIGGSFTVGVAERIGLNGILLYKGKDMIRTAVRNALEICQIQQEGIRRISQLNAIVHNFTEGLLLADERGRVILHNPPAQRYLRTEKLLGKRLSRLLGTETYRDVLNHGKNVLNVVEKEALVTNYIPVRSPGGIHGLICTFKKVDEIQDAEFTVRKKLHDKGFAVKYQLDDIIGESEAIRSCKERVLQFAGANGPVLITGESGTGKELFAHSLHALSSRRNGPFVAINCATLPSELLESELFGYEKGAFTGAHTAGKRGLIEIAHKGTLFLDEITSLNYLLQAKLLRLLSEQEILKLGSDRIIPVDIRILAATNDDIEACVRERRFREDLYYRLNAFRLHIPPLRERPEDLVPLFLHFVAAFRGDLLQTINRKKTLIQNVLLRESLRGNAREVENVAKRFCLLFQPGKDENGIESLLEDCLESRMLPGHGKEEIPSDLRTALRQTEKKILEDLARRYRNKTELSRILDMDRSSLWRKLKKYGIEA